MRWDIETDCLSFRSVLRQHSCSKYIESSVYSQKDSMSWLIFATLHTVEDKNSVIINVNASFCTQIARLFITIIAFAATQCAFCICTEYQTMDFFV
mmetsp:Transcript_5927/g.10518  ORF Transcript_5927/g.10518 Transcript_5927/m.10518 type:complete len:96 (-) Transcript_5927:421-708(-)